MPQSRDPWALAPRMPRKDVNALTLPISTQPLGSTGDSKLQPVDMPMTPTDLAAEFLDRNLSSARLSEELRGLVRGAACSIPIVETEQGLLGLSYRGEVFAIAHDELAMFEIAKRATDDSTVIVFGLGVGHAVRQLRALTRARIAVFEPDPGIVRTHFESGPSDLCDIPIACSVHDLTQLWTRLSHGNQSVTLVTTPGYPQLFPEQAQQLSAALAELVQRNGINDATHRLRARVWIQDLLENIHLLAEYPSFLALAGKYRGVPAFIVGAGPSLGKNGKLLAEATQKGLVFAVNSSARALAEYGVEPQILTCMESIDVSHLLKDVPYIDRVVRAFSLTAHPQTLRTGSGPALPVFEGIPQLNAPMRALLGVQGLAVAGSVSTLAFALAQRLGCSPIVFVGQDLAYTDGQAYAPGTPYQNSRARKSADGEYLEHDWCETLKTTHNQGVNKMHEREPLREVEAWGGSGTVFSTLGFAAIRSWLETASVVLARETPELRLINATEGGARIPGFEELRLEQVLRELPTQQISARELSEAAHRTTPPLSRDRLQGWCRENAELAQNVRRAARRIRRLTEVALAALKGGNASQVVRNFSKLEHAENELRQAVARMPFVDAWAHADLEMGDESAPADSPSDDQQNAQRGLLREQRIAIVIERAAGEVQTEIERVGRALNMEATRGADEAEQATV